MQGKVWTAAAILVLSALQASPSLAGHLRPEKAYQEEWCRAAGGQTEVILWDRSRVDWVTHEYAIEVEFAPKWQEAVGQALYYAIELGKKPGIVLILEPPEDQKYLERLRRVAGCYGIQIWTVGPGSN